MALTERHVARVTRDVPFTGYNPAFTYCSDDDYEAIVRGLIDSCPTPDDLWLFASGSLIWKPETDYLESRIGRIGGYHRSFCMRIIQYRATPDEPGLMMALDRGGQCKGVVFRLNPEAMEDQLHKLARREMRTLPSNNTPKWVTAETDRGPVRALAFVMNREGPSYVGRQPLDQTVRMLARACGHVGSCAEYLYNTVAHLEELGIHDRHLWMLQERVAAQIAEDCGMAADGAR